MRHQNTCSTNASRDTTKPVPDFHAAQSDLLIHDVVVHWWVPLQGQGISDAGKEVRLIPMSELVWQSIDETEVMEAIVGLEKERGYLAAQEQVTTSLSDRDWRPLPILQAAGSIEGTTGLRSIDLKDRAALGNYRVKIYGF